MDLKSLQKQWEAFGRDDPLWSILGDPAKRHGRWNPAEFFATGASEIRGAMMFLDAQLPAIPRRRALDFGCGVGRLSQALCDHFQTCDGVDIAPAMIERARQFNRHGDRCTYHVNAVDDLSLFESDSFDLIYSTVVLQHMPPELFERYIQEFVRVLHPDGLAVFQLPDQAGSLRAPTVVSAHDPLSDDAFVVSIEPAERALAVESDRDVIVHAVVTNLSRVTWPCSGEPDGRLKLHLGNHWLDRRGRSLLADDGRASLPSDLRPGQSAAIEIWVRTPDRSGEYLLELDMVQEGVAWFQHKGGTTARIPVRVSGRSVRLRDRIRRFLQRLQAPAQTTPAEASSTKLLMYGASPSRVEHLIAEAGGRVIDIRRDGSPTEWPGYVYTVAKDPSRRPLDVAHFVEVQQTTMMAARASIVPDVRELALTPGQSVSIDVRVRNESATTWRGPDALAGVGDIRLGNHWLTPGGALMQLDDGRADLPCSVPPGEEVRIGLDVRAPAHAGNYLLEVDMVREGVAWFHQLGSRTAQILVQVSERARSE